MSQVEPEDQIFTSSQNLSLIEKRRQQIVDGACKIFFKKGYHPTTTRDIASACGMSVGQLYHYISSKDDVLYLVHKHTQALWYNHLRKSEIETIDDPLEKFSKALHQSLIFITKNKKLFQFIYSESKYLDKKHLKIVLDMDSKNVIGFWRDLLSELKKKYTIKGDEEFLSSLIAYLMVFLALRGWTLKEKTGSNYADSLVDFILRGLGAV
ncbi:TetR/AcrR family transcriptional regulator [Thermodesulfobacteriota bacterium]